MATSGSRSVTRAAPVDTDLDSPGLAYLQGYLRLLWNRAASLVAERRAADQNPDSRFRGLYISDADTGAILAGEPPDLTRAALARLETGPLAELDTEAEAALSDGADVRLYRLAANFGLDELDVALVVAAAAPDVDRRFERLYGYLNDDVSRRRASVGLALELCGVPVADAAGRARLQSPSRLIDAGLVVVDDLDRPALTRSVRVPDRVVAFLLGDDRPPSELVAAAVPWIRGEAADGEVLARAVTSGLAAVYVQEASGWGALSWAGSALADADINAVAIDATAIADEQSQGPIARCARREALLRSAVLLVSNLDALAAGGPDQVRAWTDGPGAVVFTGTVHWDNQWSREPPLVLEAPLPSIDSRARMWSSLGEPDIRLADEQWTGLAAYRLAPEQMARAVSGARQRAAMHSREVEVRDLYAGARAQNGSGLERLARRIEPRACFADLVVPADVADQLHGIVARARHRETVLDDWAMGSASSRGRAVTALFAGDPGTGKTMSAEVLAGALGFGLYVVDLSSVVDKYVGETEKKLDQIFREAETVNAVLLFDEADAIFGKRSGVKTAQDRYANLEISYLLQRMEHFDGIAVLTTNLRSNIDTAFLRRLDMLVDFPMPEQDERTTLWKMQLSAPVPLGDDVDIDFLATSFPLSGGNIRNIALAAAYAAAAAGSALSMTQLIQATAAEYRKLGRLCVASEFGPYLDQVQPA